MGGYPYWYFTKYTANLNEALQDLRDREFRAGRYHPVMRFVDFPLDAKSALCSHWSQYHLREQMGSGSALGLTFGSSLSHLLTQMVLTPVRRRRPSTLP